MSDGTPLLSNKAADAREAMAALISSRSIPVHESEGAIYADAVAELAWLIADAMHAHGSERRGAPSSGGKRGGR